MVTLLSSTHRFTGKSRKHFSPYVYINYICNTSPRHKPCTFLLFVEIRLPIRQRWTLPSLTCLRQSRKLLVRVHKTWVRHDTLNSREGVSQLTTHLSLQDTCWFKRGQRTWRPSVLLRTWRSFEDEQSGMLLVKTSQDSQPIGLLFPRRSSNLSLFLFFSSCPTVSSLVGGAAVLFCPTSILSTWAFAPWRKSAMETSSSSGTRTCATQTKATGRSCSNQKAKLLT